jgi:O-methyltransferase
MTLEDQSAIRDRLRPPTLVPPDYINMYLHCAKVAIERAGDIIEIGVYKGGSLFRLAEYLQDAHAPAMASKRLIGIDTFEGHPYDDPTEPDHPKGRFNDVSYDDVKNSLAIFPFVDVLKGVSTDVFSNFRATQQFCLAHIDVDIKRSAIDTLNYVYPRVSVGGIIIFDEYQGYGQESYINDYFSDKSVNRLPRPQGHGHGGYGLIVQKMG